MKGAIDETSDGATPARLTGAAARREKGRQEMRAAILAEARRLLTEQGPDAVSMRAIARAIGYTPGALYEYFPAKEDIFHALYFEGADGLAGRMAAAKAAIPPGTPSLAALKNLGRAYRAFAHEQPELFRLVFGPPHERPRHKLKADPGERPGFDTLVATIEEGIARGDVVPLPPLALAVACWAQVHGFVVLELNGHLGDLDDPADAAQREALFAVAADRIAYGVRSPES
jgi:AcrR family transcriptional regulator